MADATGRSLGAWRLVWFVAAGVLAIGLGFQMLPTRVSERFSPPQSLAGMVPLFAAGWDVRDEPLGATELERSEVRSILQFSDYVFRVYRSGDVEIGIYIAYWKPGAHTVVSAGGHSPDVCWVQSGWERLGSEDETVFTIAGQKSVPAQIRTFMRGPDTKRHVVFWHLMDGVRTGYALGDPSNWRRRAPVIMAALARSRLGLVQAGQYFVRIHSNRPIADIAREPLFVALLRSVDACGVFGPEGLPRGDNRS